LFHKHSHQEIWQQCQTHCSQPSGYPPIKTQPYSQWPHHGHSSSAFKVSFRALLLSFCWRWPCNPHPRRTIRICHGADQWGLARVYPRLHINTASWKQHAVHEIFLKGKAACTKILGAQEDRCWYSPIRQKRRNGRMQKAQRL
jgi:hypothetical protein